MTVRDLVEQLLEFDQDLEVTVSDGFKCYFYRGDFEVTEFETISGELTVDIGIGGCEEEDQ